MQFMFGAGEFYGVPLTDSDGNAVTNPTPVRIGVMQAQSLNVDGDLKELHGQYQYAMDGARGKGKIGGKIEFSQISGRAINSLFFGQTQTTGTLNAVYSDTTGTVIPGTPFTITATPPASGTFAEDLGVIDANGIAFTRVASAPAAGQYSVNVGTGVYTFATADASKRVFISYRYTATTGMTGARSLVVNNALMGNCPTFKGLAHCEYKGKKALVVLPVVMATKLALLATKLDDHNAQSIEYTVYSNGVGSVFEIHTQE
jgi:hypothetical protein